MKKVRFSEEQMVAILREADKAPVAEVARKHKISEQTIYNWRRHFAGLDPADIKRLRTLESENAKLKRILAERDLSKRRACELLDVARSALTYRSVRDERDALPLAAMKRLAAEYPRYGYRRIRIFLRREGHAMSRHRAHRLWRLAGLQLPRRRRRRRVATPRPRPLPAMRANHVWAYDFVFDRCANGQQLKCLTLIDEFTRECLAIDVVGSIRSTRVIEVLSRLISERGAPRYLRSDNGPEFVSKAILEWLDAEYIETALIDPGKPWQNGTDESFNGRFRDECLAQAHFPTLARARAEIEIWRVDYNCERPHSALDYTTPKAFGDLARSNVPPSAVAAAAKFGERPQSGTLTSESNRVEDRYGVN